MPDATRLSQCPVCNSLIEVGDPILKGRTHGWGHRECIDKFDSRGWMMGRGRRVDG